MKRLLILISLIILSIIPKGILAQEQVFSLESCINYALENSTNITRANNNIEVQDANLERAKAERTPNLMFNASQSLNSVNVYQNSTSGSDWLKSNNSSLNMTLSSEVTLYNGAKIKNTITQSKTNLEASQVDIQSQKEQISLSILSSYINALLAMENLENYSAQLISTEKQLELAQARKTAGIISTSDFLNIKSQYASDKATVVGARNSLRINMVALMQLMNMPISDSFSIKKPDVDNLIMATEKVDPDKVYNVALGIQHVIKSANLSIQSSQMDIKIAKSDGMPNLSLGGGISTGYSSSLSAVNFSEQFSNKLNPYIGLSLSVPIYQRKKVKTNITIANIQLQNQELELVDIKNDLRKYIEQACIDDQIAISNFLALKEQYDAENESYQLSNEMFTQGMMNAIDLLSSKNNLVTAEIKLTQAKYSVLLQNKIIDYYKGETILF